MRKTILGVLLILSIASYLYAATLPPAASKIIRYGIETPEEVGKRTESELLNGASYITIYRGYSGIFQVSAHFPCPL